LLEVSLSRVVDSESNQECDGDWLQDDLGYEIETVGQR
jgi:hypothetical protein